MVRGDDEKEERAQEKKAKEEEYDTFDGWIGKKRCVKRGERHQRRNDIGTCLFAKSQTKPIDERVLNRFHDFMGEVDMDDYFYWERD